jgi:hypothetical protein
MRGTSGLVLVNQRVPTWSPAAEHRVNGRPAFDENEQLIALRVCTIE